MATKLYIACQCRCLASKIIIIPFAVYASFLLFLSLGSLWVNEFNSFTAAAMNGVFIGTKWRDNDTLWCSWMQVITTIDVTVWAQHRAKELHHGFVQMLDQLVYPCYLLPLFYPSTSVLWCRYCYSPYCHIMICHPQEWAQASHIICCQMITFVSY